MAYNVRIQPSALIELDEIVSYLMVFGPHTAQSFLDNWEAMLDELRDGIVEHALSRFEVLAKDRVPNVGVRDRFPGRRKQEAVIA